MAAQHDPQQEKKSGRRGERLKISAGGSGSGVLLVGCALIAAGIGAAFVAHTARSFRNRGKDRRNCRKDDRVEQGKRGDHDLVSSVDRNDDDPQEEITVDCLVGVQENTGEKSEIAVERRKIQPNFEGLEIMAKLEQDAKIPSIKFHEDKESSNEGKGEKGEEGLEGMGGSSMGSNAEQLRPAEVIEQEMKHMLEEPETLDDNMLGMAQDKDNGDIWNLHTNQLEGESCSDSSVSSQRDTLTESEESEESQITCKNFEMTTTARESELGNNTDGGEDVVQDWGQNSSTPERLSKQNFEVELTDAHEDEPMLFKEDNRESISVQDHNGDETSKEISVKTEMMVNSANDHIIVYHLPSTDCKQQKKQVFADGLEEIQKTANNSEIAMESLHRHKTYKNPDQVVMETRERQFIVSMEDGSDLVQERSFQNVEFSKILQDETNQNRDELIDANTEEEEGSSTASKEQEREAPVKEEDMRTEGSERTGNSSMEPNDNVVRPADLIDQVKVSESVNAIKEVEEEEEEGLPIKFKEQEREAPVEEEHVRVEKGTGNTSTESNDNAIHPAESIDQVQVPNLVNATEEVGSPMKCKEQEREAPVVEEHVRVQEGSEATGNTSEESNDDAIYAAELIDQLKVSESDANKEEEVEEEGEEGSLIKPKDQERKAAVEEEHVIIEEGMKGLANSFMESDDNVIHPVELVDLENVSESVNVNIQEEEKEEEEEGSPIKSKVQEREAPVEEEHVIGEEGSLGIENSSMVSNGKAIRPAEVSDQVKVSVLVNVNNEEEDNNNKGSLIKSKEQEREASVEEEHVRVEEGSERTENSFMESNNEAIHPAELTDQVKVSELINVKDGEEREAPVDEEHARVEEGLEGTTNSSMESNDDQVKVSESVNVSKKEEEERSPKKSKQREREAPNNEKHNQVIDGSEETRISCKEPNDATFHLAELIDQVKVVELVNNTSPQLDVAEKFEDMVAPAETEYHGKTNRALEHHLPCSNLEQKEFSVDSSSTVQERTCEDAKIVIETFETQNADMNSEAVQERIADMDIGNVVAKELSTSHVTHYIFQDQEKPDLEKPEIANVKEEKEESLSKEIPENEPKLFIEEVGNRVEGSEVIGDSSMESNKEAISPIKEAEQEREFPLSELTEIEQVDDMVGLAQAEEHKEQNVPRKVAEAVVVERDRRLNVLLMSSYRVFIFVLLALGVALGLLDLLIEIASAAIRTTFPKFISNSLDNYFHPTAEL